MKNGFYFLCTMCGKLTKTMKEWYEEIKEYSVKSGEVLDYMPEPDPSGAEHLKTICLECEAEFENYTAREFLVKVENGKIEPYGDYWLDEMLEFEEVAKKLNLEPVFVE